MKYVLYFMGFFFVFLSTSATATAQITITEIMYDLGGVEGNETDTDREWIEIKNDSSVPIDFSEKIGANYRWRLTKASGNHQIIPFQGGNTLNPGGYAVIALKPETFLVDWPGFFGTLFKSSFSSLNNAGETLSIKDTSTDTLVDTVSYSSEWGAKGDGNSLQKVEGAWKANAPTPGTATVENSPSGDSQEQSSSGGDSSTQDESASSQEESLNTVSSSQGSSGPSPGAIQARIDKKIKTSLLGSSVFLDGSSFGVDGMPLTSARYVWSLGDGNTRDGQHISYVYQYPGAYVVVLTVSSGQYSGSDRMTLEVVPAELVISSVGASDTFYIELTNASPHEFDLRGFILQSGNTHFIIPANTYILPKGEITLSQSTTKLLYKSGDVLQLFYPNGTVAHEYQPVESRDSIVLNNAPLSYTNYNSETNTQKQKAVTPKLPSAPFVSEDAIDATDASTTPTQTAALIGAQNSHENKGGFSYWFLAIFSLVAIGVGAFFFLRVNPAEPIPREEILAEKIEIIEEDPDKDDT